jgi:Rrf2 family transcriptional regulator, iron-sulfur cluster assembly transcription factor
MRLTLTRQAEYALRILLLLATNESADRASGLHPARHKAAQIAAAAEVPAAFATRVLALLQRHGLLFARAGQHGGYTLGRAAGAISLLEVVEAVEGPLITRECVMRDGPCGQDGYCLLHDAWSAAREALRSVLARTPLSSAVAQPLRGQIATQLSSQRALSLTLPSSQQPNGAAGASAH